MQVPLGRVGVGFLLIAHTPELLYYEMCMLCLYTDEAAKVLRNPHRQG